MKITRDKLNISETIGSVSMEIIDAGNESVVMTLAHGAGADMDHSFMRRLAEELAARNITTIRFNFPYMEKRKGRPDVPAVAHATIEKVLEFARMNFPMNTLIASGKSFGGRMTSQLLCKQNNFDVKAIIFYGFPLHPANTPGTDRADHLKNTELPLLFLQGTRDTLAFTELIMSVTSKLPQSKLIMLDKADHSFKVGKKDLIVDLANYTSEYLRSVHLV